MLGGPPRRIALLLAVDCEPDERKPRPGGNAPWLGVPPTFSMLEEWRQAMLSRWRRPVVINWFWRLDPQVALLHGRDDWAFSYYAQDIDRTLRQGDRHGLHPHAWRWDEARRDWCVEHGDAAWIEAIVRRAVAGYRAHFGGAPEAFRFGDEWLSEELLRLETTLGVKYDLGLTVDQPATPGLDLSEWTTGQIPDRRAVPYLPFRWQPGRFLHPAPSADAGQPGGLWIFPGASGGAVLPPGGYGRRARLRRKLHGQPPPRPPKQGQQWVANLGFPPDRFKAAFENGLAKSGFRYALLAVRSDVAGQRPLGPRYLRQNLSLLLNHQWSARFRLVAPAGALALLGLD